MIDLLDLPKYLSENNNMVNDVKILCLLDRQIGMPNHLKMYNNTGNMAALVDIIGIDIGGKKYVMRGKSVVVLGPRSFEPVKSGRKVLVLTGNAVLKDNNYVEITLVYPMKNGGGFSLYATKTLYRDIPTMRSAYSDLMKYVDRVAQLGWNLDAFYSEFNFPFDYRVSCQGCNFDELSDGEKFVYKPNEEYRQSLIDNRPRNYAVDRRTEQLSKKVERGHIKQRKDILSLPKKFHDFDNLVDNSENKVNDRIKSFERITYKNNIDTYIGYTYKQLKAYWKSSPSTSAVTGRAVFKNVLEHVFPDYKTKYVGTVKLIDDALDYKNIIDIWYNETVPEKYEKSDFCKLVSFRKEEIYIGVIDYLLGLRQKLVEGYSYGKSLDIDMFSVLTYNPYYICLIDSRLSIEELDKLAMFFGVNFEDEEVQKFRNIAYLHNYLLNPDNQDIDENTMVLKESVLRNISTGYIISSASYKSLQTTGFILTDKLLDNLKFYINEHLNYSVFSLPREGWYECKVRGVSKYTRPIGKQKSNIEVLQDYIDSGLGIETKLDNKDYIIDYSNAYKERFIVKKLYDLYENGDKPALDSSNIEACIRGFERQKAMEWNMPTFKLEEKQADAVRMLYNPVMCLTGPAGSGKTTTAEAILYGLQALLGIEEDGIMFCAPTGKAAQRLKEIVKKPTQTIHSLFTIGGESYNILEEDSKDKKYDIKVLIVDESSMINLELMYNMLSKLPKSTRVIFMGDIEQLPPIGSGKPFYNILGMLPCVVLDVTKRASANSGITKNAEEIIYNSEILTSELKQYDDFRLLETPKDKIVKLVTGIVNYHLGRAGEKRTGDTVAASRVLQSLDVNLRPDDIQVISPVKRKHDWGTANLNKELQNVFNPRLTSQKVLKLFYGYEFNDFSKEKTPIFEEYRIGDRVIHTENNYNMLCFYYRGGSQFQLLQDKRGIMNGDVGKIQGFYFGDKLDFVDENGDEDTNTKNEFANTNDVIYVAVNYDGIDTKGIPLTYTVLYQCELMFLPEFQKIQNDENCYIVDSGDMKRLELAYALTVHKIQGSQAKLIICVMYPIRYSDFISRNMIYTSITRAVEGIYLVGNVLGNNSSITKGRKIEQTSQRLTALDKIFSSEV